jgi:hypothetical protein
MLLHRRPCFGICNENLLFYASRAAYCLWAGPSGEVHIIPVHRCSKAWLTSRAARATLEHMPLKIRKTVTSRVASWVGPFEWTIRTPGVLPLVENSVSPLDAALRYSTTQSATRRKIKRLKVQGMDQLVWEQDWLE